MIINYRRGIKCGSEDLSGNVEDIPFVLKGYQVSKTFIPYPLDSWLMLDCDGQAAHWGFEAVSPSSQPYIYSKGFQRSGAQACFVQHY